MKNYIYKILIFFLTLILFFGSVNGIIVGDIWQIDSNEIVHYLVIDPLKRKTGFDPILNKWFKEIPGTNYAYFSLGDFDNPNTNEDYAHQFLYINRSSNTILYGLYKLKIIGVKLGNYSVMFGIQRSNKDTTFHINGVADSGSVSIYQFTYNSNPDSTITVERVINTCSDIRQDLDLCYKIGLIDNKGIYNSLSKKLDNTVKMVNKGKYKTAINHLNAFINEVKAQKEKHITEYAVNILIDDARILKKYYQNQ
ncbi:MAG: hypothetical protein R6V04_07255 [bacterium]